VKKTKGGQFGSVCIAIAKRCAMSLQGGYFTKQEHSHWGFKVQRPPTKECFPRENSLFFLVSERDFAFEIPTHHLAHYAK
jgi:hypothetical protein